MVFLKRLYCTKYYKKILVKYGKARTEAFRHSFEYLGWWMVESSSSPIIMNEKEFHFHNQKGIILRCRECGLFKTHHLSYVGRWRLKYLKLLLLFLTDEKQIYKIINELHGEPVGAIGFLKKE